MEYNFRKIEEDSQKKWRELRTYAVSEDKNKQKFYVLDMFPYPSGAGLHVGHPLGYIASDIYARYMRHKGFNVLHPMGYDSFGLPAEQYAIQTGQHPAITTKNNIARYREQLDKIGFCYDWDREVRTSEPEYYKWTQWIFGLIFNSWFNKDTNKVEPLSTLIEKFEQNGTYNVYAACDEKWFKNVNISFFSPNWEGDFSATDWKSMNEEQQQTVLMQFRMAYLADSVVNWCPALGTVLANDEVKDGVSERGGHPVEQKLMRQWSMRISAYAERLLGSLEQLDWSESIKEVQRNWIGRSEGALVEFDVQGSSAKIPVFTTRPDTIFGVSFMTLAPEHALVLEITTPEYRTAIEDYIAAAKLKTERDRQSDVKNVSGQFTGAYAVHPFTGAPIPIWIGEYVLAGYGTGAVMAVPCGDQRDYDFAKKFDLPIPNILEGVDISEKAEPSKDAKLCNSEFLNGMSYKAATTRVIEEMEKLGIGKGRINYRMRDAVFSRQRYWGEPFPIFYKNELPYLMSEDDTQVTLPDVDKYLPTEDGEPPLARAQRDAWNVWKGDRMEYNTMPGWAGSSWYFLRYMDPKNPSAFASREKVDYWGQVDLYMGGAEHGTGHLLYSRFWTKVLFDLGYIGFDEPFKKMINQGMIQGRSNFVYRLNSSVWFEKKFIRELREGHPNIRFENQKFDGLRCDAFIPDLNIAIEIKNFDKSFEPIFNEYKENAKKFGVKFALIHTDEIKSFHATELLERIEDFMDFDYGKLQKSYFLSSDLRKSDQQNLQQLHVDISMVDNDVLDTQAFMHWREEYRHAEFILNDQGKYVCGVEIEKMSKSKFNVQTPDELVEKFGADTLRCYEMFLGPVEQSKPWDTKGINGVHNFLRKFWRLYHDADNNLALSDEAPTKAELKTLHKTIKKINEDLDRFSWNTCVSAFMICVNELQEQKCNKRQILEPLCVLLSPYAPHIAEELWSQLGHAESVTGAAWPLLDMANLTEDAFEYPVSFNGKTRYFISLPADMPQAEVEATVRANENTAKYLEGKEIKKMIVVPKRIVNVVV